MKIISDIENKRLLTRGIKPAGIHNFWAMDSEERFLSNRKKMGEKWEYWDKTLTYTINSQNYRAPEWDQVDWANSVVIYGCSFVLGEGVDDKDTISAQLSEIIKRPVINLGSSGTCTQWQLINQTLLLTKFCEPWATVNLWPSVNRSVLFAKKDYNLPLGFWADIHVNYFKEYLEGCNPLTQFYFFRQQSRLMHRNKWIEAAFDIDINQCYGELGIHLLPFYPDARDLVHPGKQTARLAAEWIAAQL